LVRLDTGLAATALYCYESQIPEVAAAKITGLEAHYGIKNLETIQYFKVHESADIEHANEWAKLIGGKDLAPDEVGWVADCALEALWGALDEINRSCTGRNPN